MFPFFFFYFPSGNNWSMDDSHEALSQTLCFRCKNFTPLVVKWSWRETNISKIFPFVSVWAETCTFTVAFLKTAISSKNRSITSKRRTSDARNSSVPKERVGLFIIYEGYLTDVSKNWTHFGKKNRSRNPPQPIFHEDVILEQDHL